MCAIAIKYIPVGKDQNDDPDPGEVVDFKLIPNEFFLRIPKLKSQIFQSGLI